MSRVLIPYRHPNKVLPYAQAVRAAGAEPVAVSVSDQPNIDDCRGLVLMGGTDINPQLYGQTAQPEVDPPDDERDEAEWHLLDQALDADIPILAICRGMQLLNVHHGGTLTQHLGLPRHDVETEDKGLAAHQVLLEPESHLAQVFGEPRLQVNSRHHQAVDRIGQGLRISARDDNANDRNERQGIENGIVEGLEEPTRRFLLAVQWHPEDQVLSQPEQLRLFERFVFACRATRNGKA